MIIDQVRRTIDKYRMLSRKDRIIVGVSGGMDSVALLSVLHRLRREYDTSLVVAHLNHNLRGKESRRDEKFVKNMAMKLDLPYETRTIPVRGLEKKGMTLQEVARDARFSFFRNLVRKHRAHKVALGQTADDQCETMVMRFVRGAGVGGLKGIPPVRDKLIIHPLIEVSREAIEAYLAEEGVSHVEDSSNQKDVYLRNRIRRHMIPMLEGYNPGLKASLVRMGQVLLQEDEYMTVRVQEAWSRIARLDGGVVSLDLTEFRHLHPAIQFRLLRQSMGAVSGIGVKGLGASHILSLADMAVSQRRPHAEIHLPGRFRARRIYDRLEIGKGERVSSPVFDHSVACPGVTPIQEVGKKLVVEFVGQWDLGEATSRSVFLSPRFLRLPLRVRNSREGDRFRPLGMTGSKKMKDCFIDWKVPMDERAQVPLILSEDTIVWVVGYRISQDVRVTGDTKEVIHMEVMNL